MYHSRGPLNGANESNEWDKWDALNIPNGRRADLAGSGERWLERLAKKYNGRETIRIIFLPAFPNSYTGNLPGNLLPIVF